MDIPRDRLLLMFERMLRIRYFETAVSEQFALGHIKGAVHLYLGEEAVAVGVCAALNDDDTITSTHRGHGHIIAKGGDVRRMMAELFGRATGYNKGKGGSMHIADPALGILGADGIVGGGIPIATGAAMSAKLLKDGRVAVCFFGDGASNQGTFHESINIASALALPAVYVCENNLYGVGTRQSDVRRIEDVADRGAPYGIPGVSVDGNDVVAVYEVAREAVARAREGRGPSLVECKTYRWHTHFEGEPDTYRDPQEVAAWMAREPIARFKARLLEDGLLSAAEATRIERREQDAAADAVRYADESPYPDVSEALTDVYAEPQSVGGA